MSTEGARLGGGRFNPKGCAALYLAGSPAVAVAESLRLGTIFGTAPFNPRLLVSIEVELSAVLDLSDPDVVTSLGLRSADLTADWGPDSVTQQLGDDARERGVEGILFPSRLESVVNNLCVFRENERAESRISVNGYDDVLPGETE